jgi:hypothetical protein
MKKILFIIATAFMMQVCNAQTDSFDYLGQTPSGNTPGFAAEVTGPYFGQTPPGRTPKIFAPGIMTQPGGIVTVTRIAFSPDGNECFFSGPIDWSYSSTRMYHAKCVHNVWTPHELVSFFPGYSCRQPFFSADGNTLYFGSNKNGSSDIWMVFRASEGWGTPQVLPEPINTSSYDGMYTQTKDGTIYIESDRPGGQGGFDVWRISPQQPGQTQQVQNLGAPVNTGSDDNDPFVSPDARYIIFGLNYNDLFVAFNKGNGGWTVPINLNYYYPGLNTGNQEYAPNISSDGRYLFFARPSSGNIYWVSTSSIDSLRKPNFPPYVKNPIPNQSAIKDSLFNYQIPDSTFFDDDGNNTLAYSAILNNRNPLPTWLSFDSTTRTFSGSPNSAVTIDIAVTATDTAKASTICSFIIRVVNPTTVDEEKGQLPKAIDLGQNYPNPFNPFTKIQYALDKPSQVKLTIYNLLGEKIRTLQDSFQPAGEYSLVWNAKDDNHNPVSSGVYFYHLETDESKLQKTMVLIR